MLSCLPTILLRAATLLPVVLLVGCQTIDLDATHGEAALLHAARSTPDAVTLEIYWVSLPSHESDEGQALWGHIQENRLAPDLRRRLAHNGMRAGVFGGALPSEVHRLLNPDGGEAENAAQTNSSLRETGVWRRTRQLRPGDHVELQASESRPETSLLVSRNEEMTGAIYTNAQAYYQLSTSLTPTGQSELTLTPELRHGIPKPRWTPDETGVIAHATPRRDAVVFHDLEISVPLAAGEALLVTSLPDSDARVGGHLHKLEDSTTGSRKAILIRVVQAPRGESLALVD
ncbi:MAG: hypothetical protein KDA37_13280 [Planctomycetales bacterium]|nr:hypothetical protein [Planctomycetales bacterium]